MSHKSAYPKLCRECTENKYRHEFPKTGGAVCRCCRSIYSKEWYQKNKQQRIKRNQDRRLDAQMYVYEYLKNHPCEHCGETHPVKLEFHHYRGDKKFNIGRFLSNGHGEESKLVELVKEEIDKCQVLCRNCHAEVTAIERNTFRYRMYLLDGMGN